MGVGCVRLHEVDKLDFADLSGSAYFPCVWALVEASVGIFVACAPLFRPITKAIWDGLKGIIARHREKRIQISSTDDVRLAQLAPRSLPDPKGAGFTSLTSHPPSSPDLWGHPGLERYVWSSPPPTYGAGTRGTIRSVHSTARVQSENEEQGSGIEQAGGHERLKSHVRDRYRN